MYQQWRSPRWLAPTLSERDGWPRTAPVLLSEVASNDPTDNGGLFIGRRPGTAPIRFRVRERVPGDMRGRLDGAFAWMLLALQLLLCLSLLGPQPLGWIWVGSQV